MHTRNLRTARPGLGVLAAAAATLITVLALAPGVGGQSAGASGPPQYVPGQVLVRFAPGAPAAERAKARASVNAAFSLSYTIVPDLERLKIHPGRTVEEAIAALEHNPNVLYVEPDYVVSAIVTPNDPSYGNLWGMTNINAPEAWDKSQGDPNFVVAIIDTGIDRMHPDLQGNLWENPGEIAGNRVDDDENGYVDDVHGWDFANSDNDPSDGHGHGTHVSGTIGAQGNNGVGVAGVNWHVKVAALKFLSDSGSGSTSNAILAVQYASDMGFRVSNNSWGGGGFSQGLYDAINAAKPIGHLFIAAAGNNGTNNDSTPFYPSSYNLDNLISVAAIDVSDAKASFSNYGATSVDLGAPGVGILSTLPGNSYGSWSGTSMATPHVAGAVAMLMGLHPDWSYGQVRNAILATARSIPALSGKTVTGGTLDLHAAVHYGETLAPPDAPTGLVGTPSSTQIALSWADNSNNEEGFRLERAPYGQSFSQIAQLGANVSTYTDSGLEPSTTYSYRVFAYNGALNSAYSTVDITTLPPPPAPPQVPTLISVTAVSKIVTLNWTNVLTESGYNIGRGSYNSKAKRCGGLSFLKTAAADTTSVLDQLSVGGSYCYAVQAFNPGGTSAWSNWIGIVVPKK